MERCSGRQPPPAEVFIWDPLPYRGDVKLLKTSVPYGTRPTCLVIPLPLSRSPPPRHEQESLGIARQLAYCAPVPLTAFDTA